LEAAAFSAADPLRFAGLSNDWFWEDRFQIPERMCWSEENALEVAGFRLEHRESIKKTAEYFGKTPPTIRKALKLAKELGIDATGETMNLPRSRSWAIAKAADVLSFVTERGCTEADAALHFGVAESTIRKALEHGRSGSSAELWSA
jgi:transposase-like protein